MARKSGAGGGIFVVIGVIWLMSKCGGGGSSTSTEPVPIAEPAPVSAPFVEAAETMCVNTAGLNQRSRPSGPVISKLSRGESVNVYERSGTWVRVSADGAAPLWVSNSLSVLEWLVQPHRMRIFAPPHNPGVPSSSM